MIPEEEGSDVREMVWEMSRMTNMILIIGIILVLAILTVLMYGGHSHISLFERLIGPHQHIFSANRRGGEW